jgi:SRSO17 transposase
VTFLTRDGIPLSNRNAGGEDECERSWDYRDQRGPPPLDLTPQEIAALADELVHYHAAFAELYYRKEQAHWGYKYLQGLMLPIERKSIEPMALALDGGDVQAMQQFIGQGQWQDEVLLRQHWSLVDETLGEADGVCIVDGSEFPKQGEHSVGVARQWCGRLGKVENCQAGVFAAYASRKGYTLLDRRLYLPDEWFDAAHRERWHKCGVPEDTLFKTKPTLALEMLRVIVQAGTVRFRWVTCDEAFGCEPTFLDGVAALQRWYCAEMPHDTRLWLRRPTTAVPVGPWPTAPQGPPGPRRAGAATGRSARRGAASRGVAPIPDPRGQ